MTFDYGRSMRGADSVPEVVPPKSSSIDWRERLIDFYPKNPYSSLMAPVEERGFPVNVCVRRNSGIQRLALSFRGAQGREMSLCVSLKNPETGEVVSDVTGDLKIFGWKSDFGNFVDMRHTQMMPKNCALVPVGSPEGISAELKDSLMEIGLMRPVIDNRTNRVYSVRSEDRHSCGQPYELYEFNQAMLQRMNPTGYAMYSADYEWARDRELDLAEAARQAQRDSVSLTIGGSDRRRGEDDGVDNPDPVWDFEGLG